jgi:ABC-type branched-subunit amino acid transport system ATPase component
VLLDEPSVGIAPRLKGLIFAIEQIRKDGTAKYREGRSRLRPRR